MQRIVRSLLQLTACLLLASAFQASAADPTGTWTWTFEGRNGQSREVTLKLKLDGDKLTGTISGRQTDTAIEQAKITGDEITFQITREFNGNKMVQKYMGKLSGDTLKGKIETERDGNTTSRDWEAKRTPAKTN